VSDVTRLLDAAAAGDGQAAADLLPAVYAELRALAAARLADEKAGHTLQPTALVHEAYLRLVGDGRAADWNGRGHFFAAAAEAMRRILVENARRKHAAKRGGGWQRQDLDPDQFHAWARSEAVDGLAAVDADAATLVKLRFFAGLTTAEAAAALGMSVRSAHDLWAYARTWLHRRMRAD
jgi:RNA polymerase sigma factor (TIGR02999 family)